MADITATWRACVSACKRPASGAGAGAGATAATAGVGMLLTAPPPTPGASSTTTGVGVGVGGGRRVADPFTQQAQEVLEGIQAKEELLAKSREDYVDAYRFLPSRASDMTDRERDQIDQLMASFIIKCGSQIEIIRCALAEASSLEAASTQAAGGTAAGAASVLGERGSRLAHYGGLVAYLAERLQDLSQTLQALQAQRRKLNGMAPGGAGGKGAPTGLAAAAAARSRKRLLGQGSRGTSDEGPPSPLARMAAGAGGGQRGSGGGGGRPVMAQSQGEVAEDEAFARRLAAAQEGPAGGARDPKAQRQKQLMLEQENRVLTARLNNELEDVRLMEGKMLELSQLLGLFTGKLMEQQDQVGEIFEAAASANVNVEQANDELLTTLERNSKASQTMLTFVACLCLGLLILDQIVP